MTHRLYGLLEGLIEVRYAKTKTPQLQALNTQLDIIRYQTRLLLDFEQLPMARYEYAARQVNAIGILLCPKESVQIFGYIPNAASGQTSPYQVDRPFP